MIAVNGRFLTRKTTGVERPALSVHPYLCAHADVETVVPTAHSPISGHAWEQLVLPAKVRGKVLWSPANFGPVAHKRQLLTLHDASVWDHPEWFSPSYAAWFRFIVPRAASAAQQVATVSEFSRDRIVLHLPFLKGKLRVIPWATEPLCVPSEQRSPTKAPGERRPFLLTVGSLEPRKNLGRLLEAWRTVWRSYNGVKLVVVGGQHASLKALGPVGSREGVEVLGHVQDAELVSLYRSCLGFVFPSLYEGFGLPPVEAAAFGCRLVVSALPPIKNVLGDGPIYVDPLSTESLIAGLRSLLSGSAAGVASSVPQRSWSEVAGDIYAILEGL
jgi:glycosyltransferase involved in cell wall biosynthesis